MIVDTSAIVAVLQDEPTAPRLRAALERSGRNGMSAASYVELGIVLDRHANATQQRQIQTVLNLFGIAIEPVTVEQAMVARSAYRDFGRGSGHPAKLNYGDTFSYALASVTGEPLLFVGDDFAHTDITSALRPGTTSG